MVYPGRGSARAGPDFRDSVIAMETGELLIGDVELHVAAPDWDSHHHDVDPNYNGVILHVVFYPKGRVTSDQQSGTRVPVASVATAAEALRRAEGGRLDLPGGLRGMDDERLGALLDRAGDQRFYGRSRGFALELEAGDPDESLYRALMEGLGYASNRKPFRELALKVPVALLRGLREEPATTRLLAFKAMLLRGAGLLAWAEPPDEALRLRGMLSRLPRTGAMRADRWNMFRVRPANHPARRVMGAARLVDRYVESGLVRGLEEELRGGKARRLVQALTVRPFIGRDRACDLAVNVVLPLMHALAGIRRDAVLASLCLDLYRAFPRPVDNEVTREMRRLLSSNGAKLEITGARRHQGLMHLYKVVTGQTRG